MWARRAERLNNDIQNPLDATRVSREQTGRGRNGSSPDIVNSALERRRRGSPATCAAPIWTRSPIYVDAVLVRAGLRAIVDNAEIFGRWVTIPRRRQANGRDAVLSVENGVGLTAEESAQIGERFFRGARHAATTSGSGLGLWIAKAFVTANGGKIQAVSPGADHGAAVSILLPFATPASQPEVGPDD